MRTAWRSLRGRFPLAALLPAAVVGALLVCAPFAGTTTSSLAAAHHQLAGRLAAHTSQTGPWVVLVVVYVLLGGVGALVLRSVVRRVADRGER
jgi:hypothetical protein